MAVCAQYAWHGMTCANKTRFSTHLLYSICIYLSLVRLFEFLFLLYFIVSIVIILLCVSAHRVCAFCGNRYAAAVHRRKMCSEKSHSTSFVALCVRVPVCTVGGLARE